MSLAPGSSEFTGLPVTVMGLGLFGGGSAVARWLVSRGARVTVTDLRDETVLGPALRELEGLPLELVLGRHRESDFTRAAFVVANPAVPPGSPYLRAAREAGVTITSETALFLERVRARTIVVTGTQGKSSTTSFTAQLLEHSGFRVHLGGNIGRSLLEELETMLPGDVAVIELSSYQLEALPEPPFAEPARSTVEAAAVVNVLADHLERHGTREAYARAKLRILELLRPGGLALLPAEFAAAARDLPVRALPIDGAPGWRGPSHAGGRFLFEGEELGRSADLRLPGAFQAENVAIALALARTMGAEPARLAGAIGRLRGLPHRLEPLGLRAGRLVIDNGVSTTPDSTVAVLREIAGPCTLLLGGKEKLGLSFDELASEIARRGAAAVTFGAAGPSIAAAIERAGARAVHAGDLPAAVARALELAESGSTILFSPAAASFDSYANFRARAEHFRALLPPLDPAPEEARTASGTTS
jgi:UDP-N-acetylmuramoylalanine--D-glutamate ligase